MEAKEIKKSRLIGSLIALFLSTGCTMGDMVITPIASTLYDVFDNVMIVNGIVTGPALIGIIFCVAAGPMTDRMNKKHLMIIGFAIFTVSSVFGCIIENSIYILICRLLATGVAWGITSTVAVSILSDWFLDEKQHGIIIGWYNAAMSIMGALLSLISGILALSGWQMVYRTYLFAVPILILLILFLPSMPSKHEETKTIHQNGPIKGWYYRLIPLLVQIFLVSVSFYVIGYVIAVYVAETGIGDEAFTGMLSSISTVVSALMCMCFGFLYTKMKNAIAIPAIFILAAGFYIMYLFPGKIVAIICCAIMGGAWGTFFSYFYAHCTDLVPSEMKGTAIGVVGGVNGFGVFLSSYALTTIASIVGSNLNAWPVFGTILVFVGVMTIISYKKEKKEWRS